MRLDKFLKVSRLIKRRTVANEACDAGRVVVNDKPAKASLNVKEGDIIEAYTMEEIATTIADANKAAAKKREEQAKAAAEKKAKEEAKD